jgi:Domain of unknown function (DUF4124)
MDAPMSKGISKVLLPLALLSLLAGAAAAQSEKQKKLYRWVDKQGQVHYGDSIPPEYAEQDRDVLNRQGVAVGKEEGTVTPEEAAAKAAEEKAAREEQKRKLRDRVLLQTYQSVKEIEILRDNRLDLVDANLTIQEQSLANLRAQRAQIERMAARYAPVNQAADAPPLPDGVATDLERAASDIATQEANLQRRRDERENIRKSFEADIKRYQELRSIKPR